MSAFSDFLPEDRQLVVICCFEFRPPRHLESSLNSMLLLLPPYVVRVRLSSPTQTETSVETDGRPVPSCGSQRTLSAEGEKSSPLPCPLFASEFTFSINHVVPTGATQGIPYLIQHTHVHTHAQWSSVSVADCLSPRRSSGDCN